MPHRDDPQVIKKRYTAAQRLRGRSRRERSSLINGDTSA
jgi:hypothetical protein